MKVALRDNRNRKVAKDMERINTMRKTALAIATITLILLVGCKNQSTTNAGATANNNGTTVAQSNLTPEELGELGAKIKKNPNDAQQLLSQHGLTEQSFEQAVRKVAESPEQSKRYAEAYRKAS